MLKRLFVALVTFLYLTASNAETVADPAYANMQRAVGGIIEQTAQARGFSTTDPRTYGTLYGMGKVAVSGAGGVGAGLGAGALLAGTAPAWGTVVLFAAVSAGVSYGINLAIDGLVKWAFGDPLSPTPITSTGNVSSGSDPIYAAATTAMVSGQTVWGGLCGITAGSAAAVIGAATRDPNCAYYTVPSTSNENGTITQTWTMTDDRCATLFQSFSPAAGSISQPWSSNGGSVCAGNWYTASVSCSAKQYAKGSTCFDLTSTSTTAPVLDGLKSLSDAVAALTATEKAKKVNPELLSLVANELWRQAASQPGYSGLPYSVTSPITAADVQAWQAANPGIYPTVGDMLAPVTNPSTGLVPTSPSAGTATSPTGGTQTNPGTGSQINLGADPNIGSPNLEPTPTATMILQPLLNLFPDLRSFVTPSHSAECPKPQFDIFGKVVTMDTQCTLAEGQRQALYAIMMLVWVIIALFIVLSA